MSEEKNSIKDWIECIGIVAGVTCTIWGLVIAQGALTEYQKDNQLSAQIKLDEKEARLYDRAHENDLLHSFWAYVPETLTPREKIQLQLRLLLPPKNKDSSGAQTAELKFKDAHDLERLLWAHDTYDNPAYARLREGYDFAEEMLFMAESAHNAYRAGVLTKEDWRAIDTYIDDVGSHPLFIEAVCWAHDGANFSKKFATVLKDKYMRKEELRRAALEMYPAIVNDPQWANNMGVREAPE